MFCCAIGYVGFTTYGKVTMSEAEKFMLANVEALTDGESGVGGKFTHICPLPSTLK